MTYQWDLDGDGVFGETGAAAERGDEIAPLVSAARRIGLEDVEIEATIRSARRRGGKRGD